MPTIKCLYSFHDMFRPFTSASSDLHGLIFNSGNNAVKWSQAI